LRTNKRLGERKIIEIIQSHLDSMPKMPIPFGDDVSACDIGNDMLAVLKTDMLVDRTDVPPEMTLWQAARKSVVMNVSDFAAKGVRPLAILASVGLPGNLARNDIDQIGKGLNSGAREYKTFIIGGDTNEASDIVISLSLFGTTRKGQLMLRSGAKPGDLIAVTGPFGKAAAGLKILVDGLQVSKKSRRSLLEPVLMPRARLDEGLALSQTSAVSASIDSSDGLGWSLHEIAKASNVGVLVDSPPIAEEAREFAEMNELDPSEFTFYGGEEYELVLTIKRSLWGTAEQAVRNAGGSLLLIGKVTAKKQILMEVDGRRSIIKPKGWEHFKMVQV